MEENGVLTGKVSGLLRLCFLLFASAGGAFAQQQEGNIVGEIRLVDGLFPSEWIQVTLEAHGSVVGVTYGDSEGRFSFNGLLPNAYSVVIEAEGYQPIQPDSCRQSFDRTDEHRARDPACQSQ